jgi:hypothetical protein
MLAARASGRHISRSASLKCGSRKFATVVESGGFKVAAVDNNQPTSSVTVLVKAGSRYEPVGAAGVAHGLKGFAFRVRSYLSFIQSSFCLLHPSMFIAILFLYGHILMMQCFVIGNC